MAQRDGEAREASTLKEAVRCRAVGGFIGRKGDGEPGVKVVWRGLRRLSELVAGYRLATQGQERYP